MFGKIVKTFNKYKIQFYKGEKALYNRTNEVVVVVDHSLPNVVTIKLKKKSNAYLKDFIYLDFFERKRLELDPDAAAQVIEVTVSVDELTKLPNATIADLLYD